MNNGFNLFPEEKKLDTPKNFFFSNLVQNIQDKITLAIIRQSREIILGEDEVLYITIGLKSIIKIVYIGGKYYIFDYNYSLHHIKNRVLIGKNYNTHLGWGLEADLLLSPHMNFSVKDDILIISELGGKGLVGIIILDKDDPRPLIKGEIIFDA